MFETTNQFQCCGKSCLECNCHEVVSILNACAVQRFCMIRQNLAWGRYKFQETLSKGLLGKNPQVLHFGGLQNRQNLTPTACQSYAYLKHWKKTEAFTPISLYAKEKRETHISWAK